MIPYLGELSTTTAGGGWVEMFHDGKNVHAPLPSTAKKYIVAHPQMHKQFLPIAWSCRSSDMHI